MRKSFISFLVLLLVLFIVGCGNTPEPKKEIKLSLTETEITLTVEDTYEINPVVENLENPIFDFVVSGDSITLNNNVITAVKAGEGKVTVSINDNAEVTSVELKVTVNNIIPQQITTNKDNISLLAGETFQVEYSFEPANAVANVKYVSKDEQVASVDNKGLITAVASGKTVVTVMLDVEGSDVKKEIQVEVRGTDLPVFNATEEFTKNILVNWGTEVDYLNGLTATDVEDGDITANIQVTKEIDSQEYGKQTIEYKVADKDGNEATFTKEVEVIWNYDVQFIGHQGSYYGVRNTE